MRVTIRPQGAPTVRGRLPAKVAVVGGGLAGLAAALELVDAGHEVVLHEARPTLGGAVQTLPEREGDPPPPPDNGQHIALGCFTEYLRFLERIGKGGALRREPLALPVIDERGASRRSAARALGCSRYSHLPLSRGVRIARVAPPRCGALTPGSDSDETFGDAAPRASASGRPRSTASGTSSSGRRSTCRPTRRAPTTGSSPCRPRCSAAAARRRPAPPGRAARRDARRRRRQRAREAGAASGSSPRVETPGRARRGRGDRRACRRPRPRACSARSRRRSRTRRSSASTCSSTGRSCRAPLAALLDSPGALGVRPRRADRPRAAGRRPVPDRRLQRRPRPARDPRQGLVDLMADALTERLGRAELALVAGQPRAARDLRRPARDA